MFDATTDSCRRNNIPMYFRVLIACDISNTASAARYMALIGVPFLVAHRVLLHPNRRRNAQA